MSGSFMGGGLDLDFLVRRPIAHRGLHDRASGLVENTASAFAAAITHGYAIECDLQITADGEAVVFHDELLERLSTSGGWVKEMTATDMGQIALRDSDDRVQTLGQLLQQVQGQVPLVIELKSHWDGDVRLAARALSVLEGYDGAHCLMSFDPDLVEAVRLSSPRTVRGIVADRATDPYYAALPAGRQAELQNMAHLPRSQPHFISFHFRDLPWAPVETFRAEGRPVITWTIRSPEEAAEALRHSDQITFEGFRA